MRVSVHGACAAGVKRGVEEKGRGEEKEEGGELGNGLLSLLLLL